MAVQDASASVVYKEDSDTFQLSSQNPTMTVLLSRMGIYSFLVSLILSSIWGFGYTSVARSAAFRSLSMSSAKTPLVGNGKRFEADPGSSLIVVRFICKCTFTIPGYGVF